MCVKRPPPLTSLEPSPSSDMARCPPGPQNSCFRLRREEGATYASIPMIGLTPSKPVDTLWNSYAPNMLPWSLMATAGMPCRSTSANIGLSF